MSLYVPPQFRIDDAWVLLAHIERHAFGTLVSSGPGGLQVSHLPFLLDREAERATLLAHVAIANPHARALEEATEVLAIFQGPHAYVSPSWYQQHPSVPTWNYVVVHAHCRARRMDEAQLHDMLVRLSDLHEAGQARPWRATELPAAYMSSMLAGIAGFALEVERLEGKFKLSQNRPAEIPNVIAALEREGETALAALVREHAPKPKA